MEEAADCRAAWAAFRALPSLPTDRLVVAFCCHHARHAEPLTEPEWKRINYILSFKLMWEQARRLRNFRPFSGSLPKKFVEAAKLYIETEKVLVKTRKAFRAAPEPYRKGLTAAYEAAGEPYRKAGEALEKAVRNWEPELLVLHNQQWPDNTWNGKDIF